MNFCKLINIKKENSLKKKFLIFFFVIIILFFYDLVGAISLLIVTFLTFLVVKVYPKLEFMLITALFLRILTIYIGNFVSLPDSTNDAIVFENMAFDWFQNGIFVTYDYPIYSSFFISWLIAIFYSLFDRSLLMAQSISLFFGMGSIFLGWILAKKIWGKEIAQRVGWTISLFPSIILYSVLVLREIYVAFFLLVAMYGIFNWVRDKSIKSITITILGFAIASCFHGPMIIGIFIFFIIVGLDSLKIFLKLLKSYQFTIKSFSIVIVASIVLTLFFSSKIILPKLETFSQVTKISKISKTTEARSVGDAAFPDWLNINSEFEIIYKMPIRVLYFLFSPFPWQITKITHLIGMLDSLLYLLLFYFIFRNLKTIGNNPGLIIISLILLSYFAMFGIGVGNFGTSIRHKVKFVILIILLAAPYIPKIILLKKN